jgi:hypothetical protein
MFLTEAKVNEKLHAINAMNIVENDQKEAINESFWSF